MKKMTQNKSIWVVSITDHVAISSFGTIDRIPIKTRDSEHRAAISTFVFSEFNESLILDCLRSYFEAQNIDEEVYDDDVFEVLKESDDLKLYLFNLELTNDDEEEGILDIYIQIERKTLM